MRTTHDTVELSKVSTTPNNRTNAPRTVSNSLVDPSENKSIGTSDTNVKVVINVQFGVANQCTIPTKDAEDHRIERASTVDSGVKDNRSLDLDLHPNEETKEAGQSESESMDS